MIAEKETLNGKLVVNIGSYNIPLKKGTLFYPCHPPDKDEVISYFERNILPILEDFHRNEFIKKERIRDYIERFANMPLSVKITRRVSNSYHDLSYFLNEFKQAAPAVLKEKLVILENNFKVLGIRKTVTVTDFISYTRDIWERVK
ncbi:hypothetical protein HYU07_05250 [Candidatus Woesearchaeota archaeon]|nr:hypothetical protein [Candidatus Woesearchaeota archaeon]